jgi:hypothetical protein
MGSRAEINSFLIDLTYSLGLANISPCNNNRNKVNNRVLGISISYKFGRKQKTSP